MGRTQRSRGHPALVECLDRRGRGAARRAARAGRACTDGADVRRVGGAARRRRGAHPRARAAARSSSSPITATRRSSRRALAGACAGRTRSSATTRGRARPHATPRSCACCADVPCIVVGNRSAVYAPVHDLGLVAIWDDGDPLLAEPLSPGVHARDAALIRQELDGCAVVFAGHTRTTDVERLVAARLGARRVRRAPARSPRVVLSATKEGESRGARVPSAAFAAAREALADRPRARAGRPARLCAGARVRRLPHARPAARTAAGPLHAARRGRGARVRLVRPAGARRGHARSARRRACGWPPRAASGPPTNSVARSPASASSSPTASTRCCSVDARPALVVATRGAEPIADGRLSRGRPARRRSDAAGRRSADRRVVPALVVQRGRAGRARARPCTSSGVDRLGRPRARDLDPARLRARRARRPRTAADAADGARRGARGQPRRPSTRALAALREAVPALDDDAVLGPVADATTRRRARWCASTTRTDRASPRACARSSSPMRFARGRTPGRAAPRHPRNTLRVRVDVPDLDL